MAPPLATLPLAETALSPMVVPNLPDRIADRLIEAVARRQLASGQRLIETELSEQLSVSRIPLREAIRMLESQGIVTAQPRRGARLLVFDARWAREVYDVRVALERVACRATARRIRADPAARARLERALSVIELAAAGGDIFAINTADLAFHTTIYELSGRPLLETLWAAIARHVLILFSIETYRMRDHVRIVAEHHDLMQVLRCGTPREIDEEVARHFAGMPKRAGDSTTAGRQRTGINPNKDRP